MENSQEVTDSRALTDHVPLDDPGRDGLPVTRGTAIPSSSNAPSPPPSFSETRLISECTLEMTDAETQRLTERALTLHLARLALEPSESNLRVWAQREYPRVMAFADRDPDLQWQDVLRSSGRLTGFAYPLSPTEPCCPLSAAPDTPGPGNIPSAHEYALQISSDTELTTRVLAYIANSAVLQNVPGSETVASRARGMLHSWIKKPFPEPTGSVVDDCLSCDAACGKRAVDVGNLLEAWFELTAERTQRFSRTARGQMTVPEQ